MNEIPLRKKPGSKITHGARNFGGEMCLLCQPSVCPDLPKQLSHQHGDYIWVKPGIPTCRRCLRALKKAEEERRPKRNLQNQT